MRLPDGYAAVIKQAALDVFGPATVVRLFGSRADDSKRGGDIDLHVETEPEQATINNDVRFRARLWIELDEPQVDVVVTARGSEKSWIDRAAEREGVLL